jgi:hypothetical protein
LGFAIQFLHLISKANNVWVLYANGEAIGPLKGTFPHVVSTPREVGWSYHHEFRRLVRYPCFTGHRHQHLSNWLNAGRSTAQNGSMRADIDPTRS